VKFYIALISFLSFTVPIFSQTSLVTGTILSAEDSLPIAQVHITSSTAATISNDSGTYNLFIALGDTLHFSHIAFRQKQIIANATINDIYLTPKSVNLKVVDVLNVPLPSELKAHFLSLEIEQPFDSMVLKKNLADLQKILGATAAPNTKGTGTLDWDKLTRAHRKRKKVEKWRKKYNIKPPE